MEDRQEPSIHKFDEELEYSLDAEESKYLDSVYKQTFPELKDIEFMETREEQRKGIDKKLYFENGATITFEEKKRRVAYGDILLEIWSVWEKRIEGWLYTSQADYISYFIPSSQKLYILPLLLIRKAWTRNQEQWTDQYRELRAKNEGYTTLSRAIPTRVLLPAIQREMDISIAPDDYTQQPDGTWRRAIAPPKASSELEQLRMNWRQVIGQAPEDTKRTPVIAILASAGVKPVAVEGDTVVLAFRYPVHKVLIEKMENQRVAERIIGHFLGHSCHVRCQMNKEGK